MQELLIYEQLMLWNCVELFPDKCGFLKDSTLFLLINDHPGCIMDPNTMSGTVGLRQADTLGFYPVRDMGFRTFRGHSLSAPHPISVIIAP